MKKNLLISAIVIAIVVATVAISFAAWDIFQSKDNVTFNTGDNVSLKVAKDTTFTTTDVLVPNKAIKQNDKYKYEVVMAKDIELSITTAEATVDTVEYEWDLTKVTVKTASKVIKDVDSFNDYFTLVMRPATATDDTKDIALGGKLEVSTKYNLIVKFAIDADAKEQKVSATDSTKKIYYDKTKDQEVELTDAELALESDQANFVPVMHDVFGGKFAVSEFKVRDIALEITFEAVNKAEEAKPAV